MARVRSPNYPAVGLPEAIERVRKLYELQQQTPEERRIVAHHMGYSGLNGTSMKVLSSLIKYELLEKVKGGGLRVSDLAINILFPEGKDRSQQAIREAAFAPGLFSDIRERWPDNPPTDDSLRTYLIRRQFAHSAIGEVIQNYRETIELVAHEPSGYDPSSAPPEDRKMQEPQVTPHAPQPQAPPFRAEFNGTCLEGSFRLTTPGEIDTLVKFLELNKIMITPVVGAISTEYTDDEEGRAAQKRDKEAEEQLIRDE